MVLMFGLNCSCAKKELTFSQIKNCISGNTYRYSQFNVDAIITFASDGEYSSTSYFDNGDVREGASGMWILKDKNTLVIEYNPNPFNIGQKEMKVDGCNKVIIGSTTYYKR